MAEPKPVVLTQSATNPSEYEPAPLVIVGELPVAALTPAAFVAVDDSPADAAAVAADLIAVRDSLITAGFMAAS
jgi:hypothetical protein